jgi:RNA polymerase sigma-70 factor, ECF subfamily
VEQVADVQASSDRAAREREFADLLRPMIAPGFRLALAMLHDATAAEDCVQEASFTAWRKFGNVQDRGQLQRWFLGVVANQCRNARRRRWTSGVRLGVSERLAVSSAEDRILRGSDLRQAVASLRYEDRLVVVLFFYLDMPVHEVAAVVRSSVAATRARLYRSIKRLRPGVDIEEALR